MLLDQSELKKTAKALRAVGFFDPPIKVETFVSNHLGLTPAESLLYFPVGSNLEGLVVGQLTEEREKILKQEIAIPSFTIYDDAVNSWVVAGLGFYLSNQGFGNSFIERLKFHNDVRKSLLSIAKGHDLEALGAAILSESCDFGEATKGSGDQGIDAIGKKDLISIDPAFCDGGLGSFSVSDPIPGNNVYLLASSKAAIGSQAANSKLINPAHIRELVGAWSIQRSEVGKWREIGVRMLSPLQLILITTYRLSDDSIHECRKLGIQVWSLPQIIYLICKYAPPMVFDATLNYKFSPGELRKWWKSKEPNRIKIAAPI